MSNEQFLCQACGTAFSSRAQLDRHHQREHATAENARWTITQHAVSGVKCPVCGAQFTTIHQLNRHTKHEHQS